MNCAEWERLLDAYLDGQLSGSLRLEFDAHRLRCRRCQQTVAMMEACEHVLATDARVPALPDDFTDRVMVAIEQRKPAAVRYRGLRVALVAGGLFQAAAVLAFVFYTPVQRSTVAPSNPSRPVVMPGPDYASLRDRVDREEYLVRMIERAVDARRSIASDLGGLAQYPLAMMVPDEVARSSSNLMNVNPLMGLFEAITSKAVEEDAAPVAENGQFKL